MTSTLPIWSSTPGPVDSTGASYLIVCIGSDPRARNVTARWEASAPPTRTRTLELGSLVDSHDVASYRHALSQCRTGIRIMICGGQYDVLMAMALAREHGALPVEITGHVVDTSDLPVYCVHCRNTFRAKVKAGDRTACVNCRRTLEVHSHHASAHGSFLASDAAAYDLD